MITPGSKWYFGLGIGTFVLAAIYGWTTGGTPWGPLTAGAWGAVGDHFGYGVLLAAAAVSLFVGLIVIAVRDADPEAEAQVAGTETVPVVRPATTSYWPIVAAFGVAIVVGGLISEPVVFVVGLVVLGIALVEWTVQTWADHATGDPATNRQIRNRLMFPIELPAVGLLVVAGIAIAFSRVLLAASSDDAVWVLTGVATVVLAAGVLVANRPRLSPNLVAGVLLVAGVGLIGASIAAGVSGERDFHTEGEDPLEEGAGDQPAEDEGAAPTIVVGTDMVEVTAG
jgi:hypothetical protein